MNDTPRTDEVAWPETGLVEGDFARQLERELTAARAEIERLNFALKQASSIYDAVTEQRDKEREIYGKSYSAELARSNHYKQQRDRLADIVKKIRAKYGGQLVDTDCDCSDCEFLRPIDEALQSLTTKEQ